MSRATMPQDQPSRLAFTAADAAEIYSTNKRETQP